MGCVCEEGCVGCVCEEGCVGCVCEEGCVCECVRGGLCGVACEGLWDWGMCGFVYGFYGMYNVIVVYATRVVRVICSPPTCAGTGCQRPLPCSV